MLYILIASNKFDLKQTIRVLHKYIDCLMARTTCLVCFISTVNGHCNKKKKRKEEANPWKAGASSRHTTNLKQSILRLSISMVRTIHIVLILKIMEVY